MKQKISPPPKGGFRRKWLLRVGLALAGCVALAWTVGFLLDASDLPRRWIESQVNRMVAGRLSLGKVSVSLLRGRIGADRVIFRAPDGRERIGADRLLVDLAWWGLAGRTVVLESVEAEGLRVRADRDTDGRIDLVASLAPQRPTPSPSPEPDAPSWNVIVESLTIVDGQVAMTDAVSDVTVELGGISVKLAADASSRSADADISWTRATLAAGNRSVPFGSGGWQGRYCQGRLDPMRLRVDGGPAPLVLSGYVAGVLEDDPKFDLTLKARLDLAVLRSLLPSGPSLNGSAILDARLTGYLRTPKVVLGLNCTDGRMADLPLDGLSVRAVLTDQGLDLQEAILPYAGGRISASGTMDLTRALPGGLPGGDFNADELGFQAVLNADGPRVNALTRTFAGARGRLNTQLRISGKGLDPNRLVAGIEGGVRVEAFQVAPLVRPVEVDARLAVRIDSEAVFVDDFQLRTGGAALTGTGRYDRRADRVISNTVLRVPDLALLSAAFGLEGSRGEVTANLQVQGPIDSPGLSLALNAASLEMAGVTLGTLEAKADMDPSGRVTLDRLVLASGGSRVTARGTVSMRDAHGRFHGTGPVRLKVDLENVAPADFYATAPVSGRFGGSIDLTGSISDPTAKIRLSGEAVAIAPVVVDTADLSARFEGGVLAVAHLRLKRNNSEMAASGSVGLVDPVTRQVRPDGPIDFRLSGNDLNLTEFTDRFAGRLTLAVEGAGTLNHPTGHFLLSGKNLDLGVQRLETLTASGTLDRSRVTVDTLTAVLGKGQQVTGQGWLDIDRRFSADLSSARVDLATIDAVQSWGAPRGTLTVALSGRGLIDNPQVDGTVSLSDPVLFGQRLDNASLSFSLKDGLVRFDGASDFSMAGTYALDSGDFRLSVRFEKTVLDPYFELGGRPDFKGLVSATVNAEGNMALWQRLRINAAVSQLRIRVGGKNGLIEAAYPFEAALNDGVLRIPEALFSLPGGGRLRLAGGGGMSGPMDLTVDGRIPMAAALPFFPALTEAKGDVSLTGHVGGTLEKPEIEGRIGLSKVGVAVAGLAQKIEAVDGELVMTPSAVRVEGMTGRVAEGRFDVRGTMAYQGVTPTDIDLRVSAQALPLTIPETLDLKADLALRIAGPIRTATVEGEIVLLEGLYYRDVKVSLMDQATRRTRPVAPAAAEAQAGGFGNIGLNVDVRHRQPFRVENNIASLDVVPDLKIGGTLAAPVINGRANVTSGSLFYQRKAFTVTKGVVDFLNPFKTEPTMDIAGEITVRHWRIILTLAGPTDNLRFRMTSTPAEEESDIVSLLLFGKTTLELAGKEGGGAPPAVLLARLIDSQVTDSVKRSTGLDILELDASGSTGNGLAGTRVTIGKQLSRRLSLKYAIEMADRQNVYKAISEYKLLEHVLVSGFQSSTGNFGGELLMRVEFR